MTTHHRTCNLCEAMCGIVVTTDGDRVTDLRGDPDDAFSRGHVCPKVYALRELHEDPDRLRTPVRRTANGWEPIAWDVALDECATRIADVQRRHGRHAVGTYSGNPIAHNHGAMITLPLLLAAIGTRNRYDANSQDANPRLLAAARMYGSPIALTVPDVDRTQYLLMLGANPAASNGSVMSLGDVKGRLRGIRDRGGRIVLVDPRRSETAAWCNEHVFIRPGGDAAFLAALLHVMFRDGRVQREDVRAGAVNLVGLERAVRPFTPLRVADATGIDVDTIERLAREFAAAERAVAYGRVGVCQNEFGTVASWLVEALNVVTGNFDREGGAMFPSPAADVSQAVPLLLGTKITSTRTRVRGLPDVGGQLPAAALAEEIETTGEGQIRALVTFAGNPVLSVPNGPRLSNAMSTLEFMVSIDPYLNETTRHAHIVLPPTSILERSHYDLLFHMLAVRNTAKWSPPVFAPPPDARHDWQIIQDLSLRIVAARAGRTTRAFARWASRRGLQLNPDGVIDALLRAGRYGARRGRDGLSLARLRNEPHGVDLGPLESSRGARVLRPDRKVDLAPDSFVEDLARVAAWVDGPGSTGLVLIGRRHVRTNNSWLHNCASLVKGPDRATILLNPRDAERLGITSGVCVRVTSRAGTVDAPVEISADVMFGVVSLPHGYGHAGMGDTMKIAGRTPGPNLNALTDEYRLDPLSGTAALNGVPVTVERIAP